VQIEAHVHTAMGNKEGKVDTSSFLHRCAYKGITISHYHKLH